MCQRQEQELRRRGSPADGRWAGTSGGDTPLLERGSQPRKGQMLFLPSAAETIGGRRGGCRCAVAVVSLCVAVAGERVKGRRSPYASDIPPVGMHHLLAVGPDAGRPRDVQHRSKGTATDEVRRLAGAVIDGG